MKPLAYAFLGTFCTALGMAITIFFRDSRPRDAVSPALLRTGEGLVLQRLDELYAELQRTNRELAELRGVLRLAPAERRPATPAGEDELPAVRIEPDDPATAAALAALERRLLIELEATRELIRRETGAERLVERIRNARRDVDWTAWEDVIAAWRRDPEEARRMVKLLTVDELLERYGPPTNVWSNTNGLTWQYQRTHPLEPTRVQELILRVPAGYVAQLAYRETTAEDG